MQSAFHLARLECDQPPIPGLDSRRYTRHASSLLQFFVQHRTALAAHVQRLFPKHFGTDRTVRLHLQTLVSRRELKVLRFQAFGRPNVYLLTRRGLESFQEHVDSLEAAPSALKRPVPSSNRLLHELLITEFAVGVAEACQNREDLQLLWEERHGLRRILAFSHLVPDYVFLFRGQSGMMACLTEVLSGEESPTRIGEKLQKYATWAESREAGEFLAALYGYFSATDPKPYFRLIVIVQNRRTGNDAVRLRQVIKASFDLPQHLQRRLWVTTVRDLEQARSVDASVWICGQDLADVACYWKAVLPRRRPQLLQKLTKKLPRRPLFPASNTQSCGSGYDTRSQ